MLVRFATVELAVRPTKAMVRTMTIKMGGAQVSNSGIVELVDVEEMV